ncbi:MAG: hypothetical protein ACJ786_20000 [Catenulispora sp.]
MKARQAAIFAMALAATAAFGGGTAAAATGGSVRSYTFTGTEYGYGATLDDAIHTANAQMVGDYYGCRRPYYLVADGQIADGTWWAEVKADGCQGYN